MSVRPFDNITGVEASKNSKIIALSFLHDSINSNVNHHLVEKIIFSDEAYCHFDGCVSTGNRWI